MQVRLPLALVLALAATALQVAAQDERLPLVIVHGLAGSTEQPARLARRIARGRPVLEAYPADVEALPAGSLPRDAILCVGYYREATGAPLYHADRLPIAGSIGGCPVPRTDPH